MQFVIRIEWMKLNTAVTMMPYTRGVIKKWRTFHYALMDAVRESFAYMLPIPAPDLVANNMIARVEIQNGLIAIAHTLPPASQTMFAAG